MNVVDSSGWLEYFADAANAPFFAPAIEETESLIVPVISVYEVFKRIFQQSGENDALEAIAAMLQGQVVVFDVTLALNAAKLSIDHKLPMADSIIWATARAYDATLWTQDRDFAQIEGVKYVEKL
ncbi:MAG: type II toxin-antitoxin system VapC family toxin [Chloroflexi bacterium]|nr:type II toxin-antitoxin system VapC family toxin [Chloroflexota bacterium]